ncbi:MAG: hypothetical protein IJ069_09115 [Prevotella sp.]|nr:hypothetical protein [Prevotella sp.]
MMEKRKSFLYYTDWAKQLLGLPERLRLKIDDAIKRYVLYGEEPTDKEVLYSMFSLMRSQIDRDNEKYLGRCERNRENINERWSRVNNEKYNRIQSNTTEYDRIQTIQSNTNDTDIDKDIDKDKDIDNKKENKKKKYFSLPICERRDLFLEELRKFTNRYTSTMLNDFFQYWTQPNKDGTKMKFEGQKYWLTSARLEAWKNKKF